MAKLIKLTQGKFTIVDDEDYEYLKKWKWFATNQGHTYYAVRTVRKDGKQSTVRMHRQIMDAEIGQEIDHRNRHGLDNRRKNLRFCTSTQNKANCRKYRSERYKTVYKGVRRNDRVKRGSWNVRVCYKGKGIWVGTFKSPEEAALAYNKKAIELFGEFASLNQINS